MHKVRGVDNKWWSRKEELVGDHTDRAKTSTQLNPCKEEYCHKVVWIITKLQWLKQ
jgi:hypothetical protein